MRKPLFLSLAGLWAAIIFYKAVTPFVLPDIIPLFPHVDKVLHMVAFGILAGLLFLSSFFTRTSSLGATTIYGIFIEIAQVFAERHADLLDIVADFTGAFFVVCILSSISSHFPQLNIVPTKRRQA